MKLSVSLLVRALEAQCITVIPRDAVIGRGEENVMFIEGVIILAHCQLTHDKHFGNMFNAR